jgi:pimeloyl-ACP methyl ester carboxylesterase
MSTTTTIRIAGLAADIQGHAEDTRPPLLLLHGLTFDRTMWRPALLELQSIDPARRLVTLDLPGHGESVGGAPYGPYEARDAVVAAVEAAGLHAPVIVGHSYSAILAMFYAASFPTSGIVSVDQTLQVGPFGAMLRAHAGTLRGPGYLEMWNELEASLHIELLPDDAQQLLRASCTPRQELLLGYWSPILDQDPREMQDDLADAVSAVRDARLPLTLVAGSEPGPDARAWMEQTLPGSTTIAWPGSGHFPQLARPEAFARLLASTEAWPDHTQGDGR